MPISHAPRLLCVLCSPPNPSQCTLPAVDNRPVLSRSLARFCLSPPLFVASHTHVSHTLTDIYPSLHLSLAHPRLDHSPCLGKSDAALLSVESMTNDDDDDGSSSTRLYSRLAIRLNDLPPSSFFTPPPSLSFAIRHRLLSPGSPNSYVHALMLYHPPASVFFLSSRPISVHSSYTYNIHSRESLLPQPPPSSFSTSVSISERLTHSPGFFLFHGVSHCQKFNTIIIIIN